MSSSSRERIFARLHQAGTETTQVPAAPLPPQPALSAEEKIERLQFLMTAMRAEVHLTDSGKWVERLAALAREKGWKELLYGPDSPIGEELGAGWPAAEEDFPALVPYTEAAEAFKERLFSVDAGVTGTLGAVADTGAVILWPTPAEPRLMSLTPPVHIAVLDADRIYGSLAEVMEAQRWAEKMPTNALLISGPSKTADIEFTLVFGVHGPKELLVLVRR